MAKSIITPEAKAKYGFGTKVYAEDVEIGQRVRIQFPYDREKHEGIVVGIERFADEYDPVGHVVLYLWNWDYEGLDDVRAWETQEVTVL